MSREADRLASALELCHRMSETCEPLGKLDIAIAAAPGRWYFRSRPHVRGVPSYPPTELVPGQWNVMPLAEATEIHFYCDLKGSPQRHPRRSARVEPGHAYVYVPTSPRFLDLVWFVRGDVYQSSTPQSPDSWVPAAVAS